MSYPDSPQCSAYTAKRLGGGEAVGDRREQFISTRIHLCPRCGPVKPRDGAAAQVISARGQRVIEMTCGGEAARIEVTQSNGHRVKQDVFGATQGISVHSA